MFIIITIIIIITDVKLSPWSEEADEDGRRTRTIYYTLYINYGIGPKSCPSVETQVYLLYSLIRCKVASLFNMLFYCQLFKRLHVYMYLAQRHILTL